MSRPSERRRGVARTATDSCRTLTRASIVVAVVVGSWALTIGSLSGPVAGASTPPVTCVGTSISIPAYNGVAPFPTADLVS